MDEISSSQECLLLDKTIADSTAHSALSSAPRSQVRCLSTTLLAVWWSPSLALSRLPSLTVEQQQCQEENRDDP